MMRLTAESAEENELANLYFVGDFEMSNSPERRLATKSDYLEMCNSNRVKCITADICEKLDDKKTEQSEVREEIHITPEKRAVLEDLSAISNHMMLGFMMRDLISDYYHGNKAAMVIDSSFLLTAIFSPLIVNSLSKRAAIMIANKFKISGYLTKGLAYGVSRAISLYVLYDFIDNTIKYIGNKSDESAKTSMEINGAFLAIDVIVDVIGILEVYGIIAGASAVAGPIGGIIAVGLVVGLNFHASHKRLQQIEKIVHLSSRDKQEEALRGFFRMDPAANVQELMNEAIANEHLKKHAMTFLANQNTYDRYFTKSGTIVDGTLQLESDATIDVQTEEQFFVSRTSPKSLNKNFTIICKLRQELKELHKLNSWLDGLMVIDNLVDALTKDPTQNLHHGYLCRNSFGIKLSRGGQALAAYFDLGDGNDVVIGFVNASNSFKLGKGHKSISGGDRDDIFTLDNLNITGQLDGASGMDTVHISGETWNGNGRLFDKEFYSNRLELQNIEVIIGRPGIPDEILCLCTFRIVRLYGGKPSDPDNIKVPNNTCLHDMVIYLDGQTEVQNSANTGHFVYVANITKTSDFFVLLDAEHNNQSLAVHDFIINQPFTTTMLSIFRQTVRLLRFSGVKGTLTIMEQENKTIPINIHFTDECRITIVGDAVHFMINSTLPMVNILGNYADKVRRNGIPWMSAYSSIDDEMVILTTSISTGPSVICTSPDYKTKIFIENCGKHLLLVNVTNNANFQKVEVKISNCSCSALVIDFNILIEKLGAWNATDNLEIIAKKHNETIDVYAIIGNKLMGSIALIDAFENKCYKNIIVRSYTDHYIIDDHRTINSSHSSESIRLFTGDNYLAEQTARYAKNQLKSTPLVFNSKYKFIFLSNINTEWFSKVQINATLGEMEFYHMGNNSLVLTNVRTLDNVDATNLCSIYLENFYQSKKLWTLSIEANLFHINLIFERERIKAARHIGVILKLLKDE